MDATLGQFIATLRKRRGWNQTRLAREAGVSVSTIAHGETGREMQASTAMAIFEALRDHTPGLRRSQAEAMISLAGLDPGLADHPRIKDDRPVTYQKQAEDALGHRLEMLTELLSRVTAQSGSPHAAADLLELLIISAEQWLNKYMPGHINQPPGDEEVVATVEHPPVQREGYTEQVRVDYVRTPDRREPQEAPPGARRHAS